MKAAIFLHHMQAVSVIVTAKIHYIRFPVTSPYTGKLTTCYGLVADLLATEPANKSATNRCNGIWETTRHNRHNGLLPAPTCYGLAMGKLV